MIAYANMKKRIQTKRKPPCKDKCRVAFVYFPLTLLITLREGGLSLIRSFCIYLLPIALLCSARVSYRNLTSLSSFYVHFFAAKETNQRKQPPAKGLRGNHRLSAPCGFETRFAQTVSPKPLRRLRGISFAQTVSSRREIPRCFWTYSYLWLPLRGSCRRS